MIRVLSIGPFDPCRVSIGHKRALAGTGIEYRVAVKRAVTPAHVAGADWYEERVIGWNVNGTVVEQNDKLDRQALIDYANAADIVQIHPGIGDGVDVGDGFSFIEEAKLFGIDLGQLRAKKVAYFHGSAGTWRYLKHYADHYRDYALAASTLDYACELKAAYLPPLIELFDPVPLRADDDPLIVCQTTTNPAICHAAEFMRACSDASVIARVPQRWLPPAQTIQFKRACNVGFDHLRGSFSVNTLENCSLGLVPLVGLKPQYRDYGLAHGLDCATDPAPRIVTEDDLRKVLGDLSASPWWTRMLQHRARNWFEREFNVIKIRDRLIKFYGGLG